MPPPTPYSVDFDEIRFVKLRNGTRKELGHGSFGRVYLADYAGEKVAVKLIDYSILPKESRRGGDGTNALGVDVDKIEAMLLKEASVQFLIRHDFVVAVHGVSIHRGDGTEDDPPEFAIVMQYMPGQNLTGWLASDGNNATTRQRLIMLQQLASAVRFMHGKGILHGDLKSDNVLLDGEGRPRIADFGTAVHRAALGATALNSTLRRARGAPLYMDPALADGRTAFTSACDVYSFGVLMWQMLSGRLPFVGPIGGGGEEARVQREQDVDEHRKLVAAGARPDLAALPADTPTAIRALITSCWSGEPPARPPMTEVEAVLQAAAAALPDRAAVPVAVAAAVALEDPDAARARALAIALAGHQDNAVWPANCPVCGDRLEPGQRVRLCTAGHVMCKSCAARAVRMAVEDPEAVRRAPHCPHSRSGTWAGCCFIDEQALVSLLQVQPAAGATANADDGISPAMLRRFSAMRDDFAIEAGQSGEWTSLKCPRPVCGERRWTPKPLLSAGAGPRLCFGCAHLFCGGCQLPWQPSLAEGGHGNGASCAAVAAHKAAIVEAEAQARLRDASSKGCPQCGQVICFSIGHGCHHQVCPGCRAQFCFCCLTIKDPAVDPRWTSPDGHIRHSCVLGCPFSCDDGKAACDCAVCPFCTPGAPCDTCIANAGGPPCPACRNPAETATERSNREAIRAQTIDGARATNTSWTGPRVIITAGDRQAAARLKAEAERAAQLRLQAKPAAGALLIACKSGIVALALQLLARGADINENDQVCDVLRGSWSERIRRRLFVHDDFDITVCGLIFVFRLLSLVGAPTHRGGRVLID